MHCFQVYYEYEYSVVALCLTILYCAPMLLLRFQINLDPGKGEFNFDQQALKLEYVPPASSGEVERATIQIMDKGEKKNNLQRW